MKVIVQDLTTREFLTDSGEWLADREAARDFYTLLRAYHFARNCTCRPFHVVLYSPDDNYTASIIDGIGIASNEAPARERVRQPAPAMPSCRKRQRGQESLFAHPGKTTSRFALN